MLNLSDIIFLRTAAHSISPPLMPYFHFTNILMKPLPLLITQITKISGKRSRWLYRKWSLILMLAPISCKCLVTWSKSLCSWLLFYFPKNSWQLPQRHSKHRILFHSLNLESRNHLLVFLSEGHQKYQLLIFLSLIPETWCKYIWNSHHPCWVLLQIVSWYPTRYEREVKWF